MPAIMTIHDSPDGWIRMEPVVRALHASPVLRTAGDPADGPQGDPEALLDSMRPDAVLVGAATSRSLAAASAASRRGIPVAHLSAGRRSSLSAQAGPVDRDLDRIADLHLAPTEHAARVLLAASIPDDRIVVTGDTVVDAVRSIGAARRGDGPGIVLVVAHRPENAGAPLRRIGAAVRVLAGRFPRQAFVLSAAPELAVHAGLGSGPGRAPNIHSIAQPGFPGLMELIGRSALVLTDCTRVEEVAPSLDVPVLILGDTTSRPEGVLAGTSAVVGTRVEKLVEEASAVLSDPVRHALMAGTASPFGDGRAAERVVAALAALLGCGSRLPDFATPLRRESVAAR
jgi:UDP-N-acetylglucosamine 2-epimerase (non-hydrolysing)